MSSPTDNLPDVSTWQPREDASEQLSNLLFQRCARIEQRIIDRAKDEKIGVVDNFDSGPGVEDIVRDELSKLLPTRYSVKCGKVDDRYGRTAGDCDCVVFNELWFPFIRSGATDASRNFHFPVESAYSVMEIKTTLGFSELDEAMEKMVKCHRLHRPTTPDDRVVENRSVDGCPHGVRNSLYSAIIAVNLAPGITLDDLIYRFVTLCSRLKREEIVRALCVLGHGAVLWGIRDENGQSKPALFINDHRERIYPTYNRAEVLGSAFYPFINDLLLNLYHMILSPDDLQTKYGLGNHVVSIPSDPKWSLDPGVRPEIRDPESPK
jgi:hypothetical protein